MRDYEEMCNEPGSSIKPDPSAQLREVLRPCIVGLGPNDLHVKPLLRFNDGGEHVSLQGGCIGVSIKDTVYYATRRRYLTLPTNQKSRRRQKGGVTSSSGGKRGEILDGETPGLSYIERLYEDGGK